MKNKDDLQFLFKIFYLIIDFLFNYVTLKVFFLILCLLWNVKFFLNNN